jgi:hypothetical protein
MSTCGVNQRQKYMEMSSAGMLYFPTLNVSDLIRQNTYEAILSGEKVF